MRHVRIGSLWRVITRFLMAVAVWMARRSISDDGGVRGREGGRTVGLAELCVPRVQVLDKAIALPKRQKEDSYADRYTSVR